MGNSQQVCIWLQKYRNDKFRSDQKLKQFFYIPYVVWKISILTKNAKIYIFDL